MFRKILGKNLHFIANAVTYPQGQLKTMAQNEGQDQPERQGDRGLSGRLLHLQLCREGHGLGGERRSAVRQGEQHPGAYRRGHPRRGSTDLHELL